MRSQYFNAMVLCALCTSAIANDSTVEYHSVFNGYQSFVDEPLSDWYQANQTVQQIGGWRVYMQEAMQTESKSNSKHSHSLHPDTHNPHHSQQDSSMQGGAK